MPIESQSKENDFDPAREDAEARLRSDPGASLSTETVDTLGDALPREMTRVRDQVLAQFLQLRDMKLTNVIVEPQIMMIRAELDAAQKAIMEGDIVAMLRIYESLKGYEA